MPARWPVARRSWRPARCFPAAGAVVLTVRRPELHDVCDIRAGMPWRTDVVATIARELGLEEVMFEAADPEAFGWYVKNYGPEVNLFIDHSQIVQLECLRRGIWGTKSLLGRVVTYPGA
jgi:phosphosulfolactate synthase (CoM biosynthesis protein A)